MKHKACHCCGLVHRVPALAPRQRARCTRCGATVHSPVDRDRAAARTAAAALGALILYFPAVTLPILEVRQLGHYSATSILGGIRELFASGSYFVGGVVLLFSIIFPFVKLAALLELSWLGLLRSRQQAFTYRVMEHAGKWSMMDVLLLAFLVMLVKVGDLVSFQFGLGVVAFTLCVVMSLVASMSFDPHVVWEDPK